VSGTDAHPAKIAAIAPDNIILFIRFMIASMCGLLHVGRGPIAAFRFLSQGANTRLELIRGTPRRGTLRSRDRELRKQLGLLRVTQGWLFLVIVERAARLLEVIARFLQLECARLRITYILLSLPHGSFASRDALLRHLGYTAAAHEQDRRREDDGPGA
jgi:hypothetical protein